MKSGPLQKFVILGCRSRRHFEKQFDGSAVFQKAVYSFFSDVSPSGIFGSRYQTRMKTVLSHIDIDAFRIFESRACNLAKQKTRISPYYSSKEDYRAQLGEAVSKLSELQNLLYADNRYALLLIFQAPDAAGKDSAIKHVLSGVNPQGCQVASFKQPSSEDLEHDFLWRTTKHLPERGRIGVFNRSYYEEVLVVRVHPELLEKQRLPPTERKRSDIWNQRFNSIVQHEKHLVRNGTHVVKFFLNVSKDEQRKRFLARLDDPKKNWKFSGADLTERKFWNDYRRAYQECLTRTSSEEAPWYVVPADDKENAHLIIAEIIASTLTRMKLRYPVLSGAEKTQLLRARRSLSK